MSYIKTEHAAKALKIYKTKVSKQADNKINELVDINRKLVQKYIQKEKELQAHQSRIRGGEEDFSDIINSMADLTIAGYRERLTQNELEELDRILNN